MPSSLHNQARSYVASGSHDAAGDALEFRDLSNDVILSRPAAAWAAYPGVIASRMPSGLSQCLAVIQSAIESVARPDARENLSSKLEQHPLGGNPFVEPRIEANAKLVRDDIHLFLTRDLNQRSLASSFSECRVIPDAAHEAMRDLMRMRALAMKDKARQQLHSVLLRLGRIFSGEHFLRREPILWISGLLLREAERELGASQRIASAMPDRRNQSRVRHIICALVTASLLCHCLWLQGRQRA